MTKTRPRLKAKVNRLVHQDQLNPISLWVEFGLHRGELSLEEEGAKDRSIRTYHIGLPNEIGVLSQDARMVLNLKQWKGFAHGSDGAVLPEPKRLWHGPVVPERWGRGPGVLKAKRLVEALNSGTVSVTPPPAIGKEASSNVQRRTRLARRSV